MDVLLNRAVPFDFTVFGEDGFSKIDGLQNADFSIDLLKSNTLQDQAMKDAVLTEIPISELEAPSGRYGGNATFNSTGLWAIEITYGARKQRFRREFNVVSFLPAEGPRARGV